MMRSEINKESLELHRRHKGKMAISAKVPLETTEDLSRAYTPGVGHVCSVIHDGGSELTERELTVTGNAVAVVTDGSAVLGLGDIGPRAAMPVMEGKAVLFKKLADVDAWPLCLDARSADAIVEVVRAVAPGFSGINLEDISAPRCFEVEERLQDLGIPVMHDDQHGTAIVLLAGLLNACRVTGKAFSELRVVLSGAGAAGRAIVRLLQCVEQSPVHCSTVKEVLVCDSQGLIHEWRENLSPVKREILEISNPENLKGTLQDALEGADVLVGVSRGNLLKPEDIRRMAPDPLIFALANPTPEIMPEAAFAGGARVVATGRSDFPNQVNNVLAFPGLFRGALDARAPTITNSMKLAAAQAIAESVKEPQLDAILPPALDPEVPQNVARAVAEAAENADPRRSGQTH